MTLYRLTRIEHDGVATRGELLAPLGPHAFTRIAWTLEDRYRPKKVPGTTRIPAGRYQLELKPVGTSRFDVRASGILAASGHAYHGMIRLRNVPNFSEVLIHWGNYHTDTEGCILVGRTKMRGGDGALAVGASQAAFADIYSRIAADIRAGFSELYIWNEDGTPLEG